MRTVVVNVDRCWTIFHWFAGRCEQKFVEVIKTGSCLRITPRLSEVAVSFA